MQNVAVFIDAGYLSKVVESLVGRLRLDYERFGKAVAGDQVLFRTYYFDCLPYIDKNSPARERAFYESRVALFNGLARLPRFELRRGELARAGYDAAGRPLYKQKKIDVTISLDMTNLASTKAVSHVALVAGDQDFVPAVERVKNDGVLVTLWHAPFGYEKVRTSRELMNICDEHQEITEDLLRRCQARKYGEAPKGERSHLDESLLEEAVHVVLALFRAGQDSPDQERFATSRVQESLWALGWDWFEIDTAIRLARRRYRDEALE